MVAAPMTPMASSLRPVSVDLGHPFGLDEAPFRRSSKKGWAVGAIATVLVVGAGGFFALKQTSASAASDPAPAFAAAAMVQPPPTPVAPPAPVTPPTTPRPEQAAMMGASPVMDPTQRTLSDEQRKKLLESDKKSMAKAKSHAGGGGGGGTYHAQTKEKSTGFTTSGNKFDPLNSSL
jgi:hypothetical protein